MCSSHSSLHSIPGRAWLLTPEQLAHDILMTADRADAADVIAGKLRAWQQLWPGAIIPYPTTTFTSPPWMPVTVPELTAEEKAGYQEQFKTGKGCVQCGGLHLRACPRVKRLVMRNNEEISEVEFWADGSWPKNDVIFPEDVYDAELNEE
jgi:hypothetical protein